MRGDPRASIVADQNMRTMNRISQSRAQRARVRRERYGLPLVAILAAFTLRGIATPGPWEQVAVTALLGGTLLLALVAAEARPVVTRVALAIVAVLVVASIVEAATGNVDIGQIYLVTVVSVIVSNLRRHSLQDRPSSPT
jgi:hypothetical protein